ncbi:MAG TPA: hypothetical protein VGF44_10205 [Terriglobales bacterium]|jgi:hypothetical protein
MYSGNLINDLISTVEQTQTKAEERMRQEKLNYWYAMAQFELSQFESKLAGVA